MSTLYPPLVSTYQPAFIGSQGFKIYFSLNSLSTTNITKLSIDCKLFYNNTFKILTDSFKISSAEDDYSGYGDYCITVNKTDDFSFVQNNYYKAQIRINDGESYSEWSSTCSAKCILEPDLYLGQFESSGSASENNIKKVYLKEFYSIGGNLNKDESSEVTEYFKNYNIIIYNIDELTGLANYDDIFWQSGYLNPDETSPFQFSVKIKRTFEQGSSYCLKVYYETVNGYIGDSGECYFSIYKLINTDSKSFISNISIDNIRGCAEITIDMSSRKYRNLVLVRAEENSNYWEEIQIFNIPNVNEYDDYAVTADDKYLTYYDYTVENGKNYKYNLREIDSYGNYTSRLSDNDMTLDSALDLEHAYLFRQGKQLCIKYNPNISNFKRNIQENQTLTIGSKYPIFRRKGLTGYKSFSLTGTIESSMDEFDTSYYSYTDKEYGVLLKRDINHSFVSDDDYFNKDYYSEFLFREAVMDFLYSDDVKLFRSSTEGSMLVKISDVSFSPNKSLSRKIWDFSATLTEVDDYSIDNCFDYDILIKHNYVADFEIEDIRIGQLPQSDYSTSSNLKELIKSNTENDEVKADKFNYVTEGYNTSNVYENLVFDKIRNFSIIIDTEKTKPYFIHKDNDGTYSSYNFYSGDNESAYKNDISGYLLKVNKFYIAIPPSGIYNFENDNFIYEIGDVEIIAPVDNVNLEMDYSYSVVKGGIVNKYVEKEILETKIGQYIIEPGDTTDYIDKISEDHYYEYDNYLSQVSQIKSIFIEGDFGTPVEIGITKNNIETITKMALNRNGILSISNLAKDEYITSLKFSEEIPSIAGGPSGGSINLEYSYLEDTKIYGTKSIENVEG